MPERETPGKVEGMPTPQSDDKEGMHLSRHLIVPGPNNRR